MNLQGRPYTLPKSSVSFCYPNTPCSIPEAVDSLYRSSRAIPKTNYLTPVSN